VTTLSSPARARRPCASSAQGADQLQIQITLCPPASLPARDPRPELLVQRVRTVGELFRLHRLRERPHRVPHVIQIVAELPLEIIRNAGRVVTDMPGGG